MNRFVARCTPWGTIQTGEYFRLLTEDEKTAVILHERAHVRNRDALRRLWWLLSLQVVFRAEWVFAQCRAQEFAADRYVHEQGHAHAMRSYLMRFPHPASALYPSSRDRVEALNG